MSWHDLKLTFNLTVVTLAIKSYPGYISEMVLARDILVRGGRRAMLWFDLDMTHKPVIVTSNSKFLSGIYIRKHNTKEIVTWQGQFFSGCRYTTL